MRALKISVFMSTGLLVNVASAQPAEPAPEVVPMQNVAPGSSAPASAQPAAGAAAVPPPNTATPPPPEQKVVVASSASVSGPIMEPAVQTKDWKFDYHGYFRAPLRLGFGHDDKPAPGQAKQTIHTSLTPDDQYFNWNYTSVQARAWAEAFFSYGNSVAKGTLALQGYNFTDSSFDKADAQFGIAQGYLTLTPSLGYKNVHFEAKVGSFWGKYGMAGKYEAGKYDTYLFGRTHLMGESIRMDIELGKWTLWGEEGFGAKAPDPNKANDAKLSLVAHGHAGLKYGKYLSLSGHYLYSWTNEEDLENTARPGQPDGNIAISGGDMAIRNTMWGELYMGFSHIEAANANTVDDGIEVLHSGGGGEFGYGIRSNFLDGINGTSKGNGSVNTVEAQYEFRLQEFLAGLKKREYEGGKPDFYAAAFTMISMVKSQDPNMDGVMKLKWGAETIVSPLKWFGVGFRFDRVQPNSKIPEQSFAIYTPRIYFKTAWITHEEVMLQFARYDYNARACPAMEPLKCAQSPSAPYLPDGFGAAQPANDPTTRGAPAKVPDINTFTMQGTMWW